MKSFPGSTLIQPDQRRTFQLGLSVFIILFCYALYFYLERMVHMDMGFQTFLILKDKTLEIQSNRFGSACVQVFPWVAQALGLSLRFVLLSFSAAYVLWPFLIFCWCLWLGQWRWGLVVLLVQTLMTTNAFYWLSELPLGLAFIAGLFAWLHSKGATEEIRWWQWPLFIPALLTAYYFHPMILFSIVFICLFFGVEKGRPAGWLGIHGLGLFFLAEITLVKYKFMDLNWYEKMSVERSEAYAALWPHWLNIQSNRNLLHWFITDYYFIPVLWFGSVCFYAMRRMWAKAALMLGFPFGFILMINVPFSGGDNQFYLENLYLPLALFCALPLVFDMLPSLAPRRFYTVLAFLFLIRLVHIGLAHQPWTARLIWEKEFLRQTAGLPDRKLTISEKQVPMDLVKQSWGSSTEFLLLSSLYHPDSARCVIIDETPERFDSLLNRPRLFLGEFQNYPFDKLPRRYFNPSDTSAYKRWNGR